MLSRAGWYSLCNRCVHFYQPLTEGLYHNNEHHCSWHCDIFLPLNNFNNNALIIASFIVHLWVTSIVYTNTHANRQPHSHSYTHAHTPPSPFTCQHIPQFKFLLGGWGRHHRLQRYKDMLIYTVFIFVDLYRYIHE